MLHVQMAHRDVAAHSKNQQTETANIKDVQGRHAIVWPDCRDNQPHWHEPYCEPDQLAICTRFAGQAQCAAAEAQPDCDYHRTKQWTASVKAKLLEQQAQEDRNAGSCVCQRLPGFARRGTKVWWWKSTAHERQNETADADREAEKYALLDQQPLVGSTAFASAAAIRAAPVNPCSAAIGRSTNAAGGRRPASPARNRRSANWMSSTNSAACAISAKIHESITAAPAVTIKAVANAAISIRPTIGDCVRRGRAVRRNPIANAIMNACICTRPWKAVACPPNYRKYDLVRKETISSHAINANWSSIAIDCRISLRKLTSLPIVLPVCCQRRVAETFPNAKHTAIAAPGRSLLRNMHELERLRAKRAGQHVPVPEVVDVDVRITEPAGPISRRPA